MRSGTIVRVAQRSNEQTQTVPPPVFGLAEAADLLGMGKASLMTIRGKSTIARRAGNVDDPSLFPVADWVISGNPVWKPSTIRAWARRTGRLDADGNTSPAKSGPRPQR